MSSAVEIQLRTGFQLLERDELSWKKEIDYLKTDSAMVI